MKANELKEKYINLVMAESWRNSPKMRKYYHETVDEVVELRDGSLIAITTPSIETQFCFGYHDSRYDTKSYDEANNMARHAETHEDYFISENLAGINRTLEELKAADGNVFIRKAYGNAPEDSKIKYLEILGDHELYRFNEGLLPAYSRLSQEDIDKIINGYEEVKVRFTKRLNTYLKRYGLSKVKSWSYWLDA